MNPNDIKNRILAAQKLLLEETTSREKFESVRTLIKGINPKLDHALDTCNQALSNIEKVQKGEIIELTTEHLPENTEEEKRRKKAILWFIKNWKSLNSELKRVQAEFDSQNNKNLSQTDKALSWAKIATAAKGPFGLVTIAALGIVVALGLLKLNQPPPKTTTPTLGLTTSTVKGIIFRDKKIPLSELELRSGPDCKEGNAEIPHYHAKNLKSVTALDGSIIPDPGSCSFGKESEVQIIDLNL